MDGRIFKLQRFCTHDGPGIRTVIFFKGCPLECKWCHNPESKKINNELLFYENKCGFCRECETVCPVGAHVFNKNGLAVTHKINREICQACGLCAQIGCTALELSGEKISADEIIKAVLKDEDFYKNSGGGVTLSGGEPMMQFDFALEIARKLKARKINVAMETSGYALREEFEKISEHVDVFLYDIKKSNPNEFKKYVGGDLEKVFENLKLLNGLGKKIILRCPIIPSVNDRQSHFEAIANLANEYENVKEINVEPYHTLGNSKWKALNKTFTTFPTPSEKDISEYVLKIRARTSIPTTLA